MTRFSAAAKRHLRNLMLPARHTRAALRLQKSILGLMVETAFAPVTALTTKPKSPRKAGKRKSGRALGAVLTQLTAARRLMLPASGGTSRQVSLASVPTGAVFLTRKHRSAAGARGYRLYVPASQPKNPNGLIVMLHGCFQSPDDFAIGTHMNALAERHGLAVAYPAQTRIHNGSACWNWFKPGSQVRGSGEPAILASLTRKLMREFGLGRDGVYVAGLSAGGAMAAILADVYPDVFSAAGIHSGLTRGAASNVFSAMSAMRNGSGSVVTAPVASKRVSPVRRIIFHGGADTTVHPSNATNIVAAAIGGNAKPMRIANRAVRGRDYVRSDFAGPDGQFLLQLWMIEGSGHAWSGGRAAGSYTDSKGPDASAEMVRFFLEG